MGGLTIIIARLRALFEIDVKKIVGSKKNAIFHQNFASEARKIMMKNYISLGSQNVESRKLALGLQVKGRVRFQNKRARSQNGRVRL